jgi:hypothetical protein
MSISLIIDDFFYGKLNAMTVCNDCCMMRFEMLSAPGVNWKLIVDCFSVAVCTAGDIGIMFLNEVALGKEHHISEDDSTLRAPPKGYDSIVAKGWTEPGQCTETSRVISY